jgi:hypothetical protein
MKILQPIIQIIRDAKTFRLTMREWLGEGGHPVHATVSQNRAEMCFLCPHNQTAPMELPASILNRHFQAKGRMKLSVHGEEKLRTCELCNCHLPLKVHVPQAFIRQYQREEVRERIKAGKPECWQLRSAD